MTTETPMTLHSLRRTSPKGKGMPFVGVCVNCGTPNLTLANMGEECPNQRGVSQEQALVEAIEEPSHDD